MIILPRIVTLLDDYLDINNIQDSYWNGLQIEGKQEVTTVAFAVDACINSFEQAIEHKVDMLITHHGHFSKKGSPNLVGWNKQRVQLLLQNNISLYVAHLPLDRHKEVGNNAQLLKLLGAEIDRKFCFDKQGNNIGWIGKTKKPLSLEQIQKTLETKLDAKITTLPFGKPNISSIAVCSGGGGYKDFMDAVESGVDLYLTGDTSDVYQIAHDAGINVIFAGHYATETVGLKALAQVLENKFKIKTIFLDLPTGL